MEVVDSSPTCIRCEKNIEKMNIDNMEKSRSLSVSDKALSGLKSSNIPDITPEQYRSFCLELVRKNPHIQSEDLVDLVRSAMILVSSGVVSINSPNKTPLSAHTACAVG